MNQRIERLTDNIEPRWELWDLCCDHGLIGQRALARHSPPKVVFVDQVDSIMRKLKNQLQYVPEVECLTEDVLNLTMPLEKVNVVIAGVGGQMIESFLKNHTFEKDYRLILGPQNKEPLLESFLTDRGQRFEKTLVQEGRRERVIFTVFG